MRGLVTTGSSVAMYRCQSLRLVASAHHHLRFAGIVASVSAHSSASLCARAGELHRQCFASVGQCAVAQIWCRLARASCWISRRLRLGLAPSMRGSCGTRPLRQSYITPHCSQCPPVSRKLLLWQPPLRALSGEGNRLYAKLPSLERSHSRRRFPVSSCPTRRRLRALVVVVAPGHQSGAARMVLVSGFAVHLVFAPAHPWGSLASQLRPRGLPVRPPRGLPQNRAKTRRLRRRPAGGGAGLDVGRYFTI